MITRYHDGIAGALLVGLEVAGSCYLFWSQDTLLDTRKCQASILAGVAILRNGDVCCMICEHRPPRYQNVLHRIATTLSREAVDKGNGRYPCIVLLAFLISNGEST